MEILTKNPTKTFLVRLSEREMDGLKAFAKKKGVSVNQMFRLLANQLATTSEL